MGDHLDQGDQRDAKQDHPIRTSLVLSKQIGKSLWEDQQILDML